MVKLDLVIAAEYTADATGFLDGRYIGVKDGRIARVSATRISGHEAAEAYEVPRGCYLLPGFIDPHGHFRDWELGYKETYATASRAAARHGIVAAGVMPNTKPPISNLDALQANINKAGLNSVVDTYFWMGMDEWENPEVLDVIRTNPRVCGSKIFTEQLENEETERRIAAAAKTGKRAAVHCEDRQTCADKEIVYRGYDFPGAYSLSRPPEAEAIAIGRACDLGQKYGTPLHVVHISSILGLERFLGYKKDSDTCETAPHYLWFTMEDMGRDPRLKMKPPLKYDVDMQHLRACLGLMDAIGTDHAPHTLQEKQGKWETNTPGIPVYDAYSGVVGFLHNVLDLDMMEISRLCSAGPARVLGIEDAGAFREGNRADFAVFDPEKEWTLTRDEIYSNCGWSPWEGTRFKGRTVATFRGGVCIAKQDGKDGPVKVIEKPGERMEI